MSLDLLSASQIKLFDECQRKWGWKYLARIEDPPKPSAQLGTEVDDTQLQPYLREGRPIDFTRPSGYIADTIVKWLPAPKTPGMGVQKHVLLSSPSGLFGYQGYLDLWIPDGALMPSFGRPGVPLVSDFKTTKDIGKWSLTPKQLATDPQAQLYAAWAMVETGKREVDLAWLYMQTAGKPKSLAVTATFSARHVAEQFLAIEAKAQTIFAVGSSTTDPLDLEPNPSACEGFGGCPYRDRCNLSPAQTLDAFAARDAARIHSKGTLVTPQEMIANLNARKAAAAGVPTAPPPAAPAPAAPAPAAPAPESLPAWATAEVDPLKARQAAFAGINPPPPAADAVPPPVVAAAPAKKGPGRPKKVVAPVEAPAEAAAPVEVVAERRPAVMPPPSSAKPIGTLYLDCYPIGGAPKTAEELYHFAQRVIAEVHSVPDYRLIDFKGSGYFATTLASIVDGGSYPELVLDTRTPEGMIAKAVLCVRAERVVQGVR